MKHLRTTFVVCCALLVLGSCASSGSSRGNLGGPEEAYATLGDPKANTNKRLNAISMLQEAVATGATSRDTARAALKRIAWSWHQGTPPEVRNAAINALLADEDDVDDTRNMLMLMVPTDQQREVLEHVCTIATERDWKDMTPAIVRSWSREVPGWDDLERPEAKALSALWPELDHDAVLFAVFSGSEGADERARAAAWAMLTRLDTDGVRTRELVQDAAPELEASGDPLGTAIGPAWRELHVVPHTPEQLAWTQRLFLPEHDAQLRAMVAAVEALPPDHAEGLALRHCSVLAWTQTHHADWLEMSREGLMEMVLQGTKGSRIYGPSVSAPSKAIQAMTWLDVLVSVVAINATRDPEVCRELFEQADDDQIDTTTEYGGVIEAEPSGVWRAICYPPRPTERFGDRQFVASQDMIKRGDFALFHYHFHVQKHSNRDYAVPSGADFETARRLGRSSMVFTFVDRDHLNIDLYFPSGELIDLGTIERPE